MLWQFTTKILRCSDAGKLLGVPVRGQKVINHILITRTGAPFPRNFDPAAIIRILNLIMKSARIFEGLPREVNPCYHTPLAPLERGVANWRSLLHGEEKIVCVAVLLTWHSAGAGRRWIRGEDWKGGRMEEWNGRGWENEETGKGMGGRVV
ncbi:MAG: hypothetical protein OXI86_08480 [Candidatus Poribacteria bacterium]|nr:hypothetical protein [Candidatus Poribacteria bacterium]